MKYLLMLTGLMVMPSFAAGDLAADDMTGVSFWLVTPIGCNSLFLR